mmetsp:Transcript_55475/g.140294  ORF Transcript_55475/g.140294 Transcript_55475/m.140294 type:complete len:203 (+) Transcript_55475:1599-2207(+)
MATDHGSVAAQRVVLRDEDGEHFAWSRRVDAELDELRPRQHFREVDPLQEILRDARPTGNAETAMLTRTQNAIDGGTPCEDGVLDAEHMWAPRTEKLKPANGIVRVIEDQRILNMPQPSIRKIFRRLPIQSVCVVRAGVIHKLYIAQVVLTNEHVVPIKLIFDHVRRLETIVAAVSGKLLTTCVVGDIPIFIPLDVPWKLAV